MGFFHYLCEVCKIKTRGTSLAYFRQFKQLYSIMNKRRMNQNDSGEIQKVSRPFGAFSVADFCFSTALPSWCAVSSYASPV